MPTSGSGLKHLAGHTAARNLIWMVEYEMTLRVEQRDRRVGAPGNGGAAGRTSWELPPCAYRDPAGAPARRGLARFRQANSTAAANWFSFWIQKCSPRWREPTPPEASLNLSVCP